MGFSLSLTRKIDGYAYSPLEIVVSIVVFLVVIILSWANYSESVSRAADKRAYRVYDQIKQGVYRDMSSSNPTRRFIIKNVVGPVSLPPPLEEIFVDEGVVLNYVIRIYESRKNGIPKDQFRFEVASERSKKRFRYVEINGRILEQVLE